MYVSKRNERKGEQRGYLLATLYKYDQHTVLVIYEMDTVSVQLTPG